MSNSTARLLGPLSSSYCLQPCIKSSRPSPRRLGSPRLCPDKRLIHHNRHPEHLRWPTNPNPTPYEIFNITNNDTYTKTRFYELAKLYHPDKNHQSNMPHLSPATRIERY